MAPATITIYPAHNSGDTVNRKDSSSDMKMIGKDFYWFFSELLGEDNLPTSSGMWKTAYIADALCDSTKNLPVHYITSLCLIVSRAVIQEAEYIAYTGI